MCHSFATQSSNLTDGVFDSFFDDPVAALKFLPVNGHFAGQDTRLHAHGNFSRAGGLGPVADKQFLRLPRSPRIRRRNRR